MADLTLLWKSQRMETTEHVVDKKSFDIDKPCLKISDRRHEAAIYRRRDDAVPGHGYFVRVRLPDIAYDICAARKADALDALYHFLPLMDFGMAQSMRAMLSAKRTRQSP